MLPRPPAGEPLLAGRASAEGETPKRHAMRIPDTMGTSSRVCLLARAFLDPVLSGLLPVVQEICLIRFGSSSIVLGCCSNRFLVVASHREVHVCVECRRNSMLTM